MRHTQWVQTDWQMGEHKEIMSNEIGHCDRQWSQQMLGSFLLRFAVSENFRAMSGGEQQGPGSPFRPKGAAKVEIWQKGVLMTSSSGQLMGHNCMRQDTSSLSTRRMWKGRTEPQLWRQVLWWGGPVRADTNQQACVKAINEDYHLC